MERPFPFESNGEAIVRLAAPANFTADVTGDTATLEWDAVATADHYEVRNGGAWSVLGDVLTTDLTDLDPGDYAAQVRAVAADGVKGHAATVAFEVEEVGGDVLAGDEGIMAGDEGTLAGAETQ